MSGITAAVALAHLETWLTAETNLADGQIVEIEGRKMTYDDLDSVREQIEFWDRRYRKLSRGSSISAHRLIVND